MSLRAIQIVLASSLMGTPREILRRMAMQADDAGQDVWLSHATIAKDIEVHRDTVRYQRRKMVTEGLIWIDGEYVYPTAKQPIYHLNLDAIAAFKPPEKWGVKRGVKVGGETPKCLSRNSRKISALEGPSPQVKKRADFADDWRTDHTRWEPIPDYGIPPPNFEDPE